MTDEFEALEAPADYLMDWFERHDYDMHGFNHNPCQNQLIEWRYDYCENCATMEKAGRMHWHGDSYLCDFSFPGPDYRDADNEGWDASIRPSDKWSTP
jgi:hypothetical protein